MLAPLDCHALALRLRGSPIGHRLIYKERTGSTNDDARVAALDGAPHGTIVVAESQSQGRGRRGSTWHAPPRASLLCSVVVRSALTPERWPRLTHACALAVCETLDAVQSLPAAQIKWPNDVYLSGKKVCGILVESVHGSGGGGFVIAGLGINVNVTADDFPPELRSRDGTATPPAEAHRHSPAATSIWLERGGQSWPREDLLAALCDRLAVQLDRAEEDFPSLVRNCAARSFLTGKRVSLRTGTRELTGRFEGLGPEGELLLRDDAGALHTIASAETVRVMGGS